MRTSRSKVNYAELLKDFISHNYKIGLAESNLRNLQKLAKALDNHDLLLNLYYSFVCYYLFYFKLTIFMVLLRNAQSMTWMYIILER